MKVYLLYTANTWIDNSSMELQMVCDSKEKAIQCAVTLEKDENDELNEDDIYNLDAYNQTQFRDTNYVIAECRMNELI